MVMGADGSETGSDGEGWFCAWAGSPISKVVTTSAA
jgi:hypothetical protein